MQRKEFRAPFWWMFIMGCVATVLSASLLYAVTGRMSYRIDIGGWRIMSFFFMPAILFVESIMYWAIRKRIRYRKDAWIHVGLFVAAYFLNIIVRAVLGFLIILHSSILRDTRTVNLMLIYVVWALIIVAHVFFVRVFVKAFARPPVEEVVETGNLLDDVLE